MFTQSFKNIVFVGLLSVLAVCGTFTLGLGATIADLSGGVEEQSANKTRPSRQTVKLQQKKMPEKMLRTGIHKLAQSNTGSVYLRVFKKENLLEVWMRPPGHMTYDLHKQFQICRWSGALGPKLKEGDKQSPEGLYNLPAKHILWNSAKWPEALNIGYPNVYDLANERTGSALLIHGGCRSTGCFAMKNKTMSKLYKIVKQARDGGQRVVSIHVFPFKMTEKNMANYASHKWAGFWESLKPFYQKFENTRQVPRGQLCKKAYKPAEAGNLARQQCMPIYSLAGLSKAVLKKHKWIGKALHKQQALRMAGRGRKAGGATAYGGLNVTTKGGRVRLKLRQHLVINCNQSLSSCRRWVALHKAKLKNGTLSSDLIEYR